MKLDFLICGTPNDAFCSQIAYFKLCLDNLGGIYKKARLVATFGDHSEEKIPKRWEPYFKDIQVEWSNENRFPNICHSAQHYHRFELIRPDADMVILVDADTVLFRPFPELIQQCIEKPALFGVIAHLRVPIEKEWHDISQNVLGRSIELKYNYTLSPPNEKFLSPFYINYGFLAGPPNLLHQAYERDLRLVDKTCSQVGPFFCAQVSLAFAIDDLNIPHTALPMRYNYPNDKVADSIHHEEIDEIILLHYLRTDHYDRHKILTNQDEFGKFINLNLDGSDKVFQQQVISTTNGKYPFS